MLQYDSSRKVFIIPEEDILRGKAIARCTLDNGNYLYLDIANLNKIKDACPKASFLYSGEMTQIIIELMKELKDTTNSIKIFESVKTILENLENNNVKT